MSTTCLSHLSTFLSPNTETFHRHTHIVQQVDRKAWLPILFIHSIQGSYHDLCLLSVCVSGDWYVQWMCLCMWAKSSSLIPSYNVQYLQQRTHRNRHIMVDSVKTIPEGKFWLWTYHLNSDDSILIWFNIGWCTKIPKFCSTYAMEENIQEIVKKLNSFVNFGNTTRD